MGPIFSNTCEYGLQMINFLARRSDSEPVHIQKISDECNIPIYYIPPILERLADAGYVAPANKSKKRYAIVKPAENIYLYDIVELLDGGESIKRCLMGMHYCDESAPCPVHQEWESLRNRLIIVLKNRSLADLSESVPAFPS